MIRTLIAFTLIYYVLYFTSNPMGFKTWLDPFYFSTSITSTVGIGEYEPKTTLTKTIVVVHLLVLFIDVRSYFVNLSSIITT